MENNFDSGSPIYSQIVDRLLNEICRGVYKPKERLPSVRELAVSLKVNPNTIQRAFTELERMGILYSERTSGRFVTEDAELIDKSREEISRKVISEFKDKMKSLGFTDEEIIRLIAGKENENG